MSVDLFAANRIIVALDDLDPTRAAELVKLLHPHVWGFKVNDLAYDPAIKGVMAAAPTRWFLDLKLHDIPNTVANTVSRLTREFAPALLTVHASGGPAMLKAAVEAGAATQTHILAVTVLTSLDAALCETLYGVPPHIKVGSLAGMARDAGCFGCVCSMHELDVVAPLKIAVVVPGIRPVWYHQEQIRAGKRMTDDQARVATPAQAMNHGASALVIGRPIVQAHDPLAAVHQTLAEIGA